MGHAEKKITQSEVLDRKARREVQLAKAGLRSNNRARLLLQLVDALFVDHLEWPQEKWTPNLEQDLRLEFFPGDRDIYSIRIHLSDKGITFPISFGIKDGDKTEIVLGDRRLAVVNHEDPKTFVNFCTEAAARIEELTRRKLTEASQKHL